MPKLSVFLSFSDFIGVIAFVAGIIVLKYYFDGTVFPLVVSLLLVVLAIIIHPNMVFFENYVYNACLAVGLLFCLFYQILERRGGIPFFQLIGIVIISAAILFGITVPFLRFFTNRHNTKKHNKRYKAK